MKAPVAPRVLIVEDEPDIAALIAYQLTREGFGVETVGTGAEALRSVRRDAPDLIVLDRMLPEVSGDEVLKTLRGHPETTNVPVLMVTARREQEDRIEGLEMGADDYLTKPFSPRELVLRVQSLLRRAEGAGNTPAGPILRAGPMKIDLRAHHVAVDGVEISLTPMEFRLLQILVERRGRTQSRTQLLESAWEVDSNVSGRLQTRTVDMHIRRLRKKLGDLGDWIHTVRGFGYRLVVPKNAEG